MQIVTKQRQGDAFRKRVLINDKSGQPLVMPVENLCAQLYRADKTMLAPLTIAADTEPGYYILSTSANTAIWPLETLKTNIFDKSDKSSTDFFFVVVTEQGSREI